MKGVTEASTENPSAARALDTGRPNPQRPARNVVGRTPISVSIRVRTSRTLACTRSSGRLLSIESPRPVVGGVFQG
jgi:hypothetical protein